MTQLWRQFYFRHRKANSYQYNYPPVGMAFSIRPGPVLSRMNQRPWSGCQISSCYKNLWYSCLDTRNTIPVYLNSLKAILMDFLSGPRTGRIQDLNIKEDHLKCNIRSWEMPIQVREVWLGSWFFCWACVWRYCWSAHCGEGNPSVYIIPDSTADRLVVMSHLITSGRPLQRKDGSLLCIHSPSRGEPTDSS